MERLLTALSMGLGIGSFAYSFTNNVYISLLFAALTIVLIYISFFLETQIKTHGNDFFNKVMYYIARNDKYIVENARYTYSYLGNGEYECEKKLTIKPNSNDLEYIEEKYSWTADSTGAKLIPINPNDKITHIHKDGLWTCYSVELDSVCSKNKTYQTGSKITNLIDQNGVAVPFYSTHITKKTKFLVMTVKFPKNQLPTNNVYFYSKPTDASKAGSTKPEKLEYDATRDGFSKKVYFPRKGWQYVISWGEN